MGRKVNTITLTEEQRSYHKPCVEQEYCCYVLMVFLLMILLIK